MRTSITIGSLAPTASAVAALFVLLLVYATAYTVFNVPYLAMPAEMSRDYHERSYLMSYRVSFIGIGQVRWVPDRGSKRWAVMVSIICRATSP